MTTDLHWAAGQCLLEAGKVLWHFSHENGSEESYAAWAGLGQSCFLDSFLVAGLAV